MDAKKKMKELLHLFDGGFNGQAVDATPEDGDSWTREDAVAELSVVEPDDDVRRYFDLDAYLDDLTQRVAEHFGAEEKAGARVRLVRGRDWRSEPMLGEWILHVRRHGSWGLEVHCYRRRTPRKTTASKATRTKRTSTTRVTGSPR